MYSKTLRLDIISEIRIKKGGIDNKYLGALKMKPVDVKNNVPKNK